MAARERYTRPPLVAQEAPTMRFARWRYRLVMLLLATAVVVVVFVVLRAAGLIEEDPGLGDALTPLLPVQGAAA